MRYFLLSKVAFPLSLNLDSSEQKSLHIGSREEVEISEKDLESKEVKKMLDKGYLFLKKKQDSPMNPVVKPAVKPVVKPVVSQPVPSVGPKE